MDNKDHLNQIPGENLDEKTSNLVNQDVEASQQTDNQKDAEPETIQAEITAVVPTDDSAPEEVNQTHPTEISDPTVSEEIAEPEAVSAATELEEQSEVEIETSEPTATPELQEKPDEEEIAEASVEVVADQQPVPEVEEPSEIVEAEKSEVLAEVPAEVIPEALPQETAATDETATEQKTAPMEAEAEKEAEAESEEDEDEVHEEEESVRDLSSMTRQELVEKLEEYIAQEDVNSIKSKVALIKLAYIKKSKEEKEEQINAVLSKQHDDEVATEEVVQAVDTIEIRFNELFDIYRQKRAVYLENLENEKVENLKKKQVILEELKALISSEETLKKTYDDFKSLQERWKEVGMVPKTEVNNLWQNYHFLVEKFFDKVKINKELKDLDLKKNLEQKIELCEKAEELLLEKSIINSFKELQRLHDLWKEIGPVPTDKNDDIWERFKSATDKINQRRRDHYNQVQGEHEQNLKQKIALCESAEQLLATEANTLKEWQAKTNQFNDLFKVWKTIGPAAKKQNDEVWERFRTAMDGFFNEKKDYFGKLKDQQINNYNIKLDLCVRAEALKDSTDWREATKELINMQKEWKEIGPVPRKHADKIWKRFRTACDEFFNNKSTHFSSIRKEENDNLLKREELVKLVKETLFDGSKSENLNKLKEFQRQWTEIGFVPFKEKDRLQTDFRNAVNKRLDELNISSNEISLSNYRSKIEVVKEAPDGNKSLSRERTFIQTKISKLREDVNVWENNIGFLANSKNANVFKSEFEKKIAAAKEELKTLESKLKLINE